MLTNPTSLGSYSCAQLALGLCTPIIINASRQSTALLPQAVLDDCKPSTFRTQLVAHVKNTHNPEVIHKTHASDSLKRPTEHKNATQGQTSRKRYICRGLFTQLPNSITMSTAIAMAPSPAPHDRSSYVDIAPSKPSKSPPALRASVSATPIHTAQRTGSGSPKVISAAKSSPNAYVHPDNPNIATTGHPHTSAIADMVIPADLEMRFRRK